MHRSNPLRRRLSGALACLLAVAAPIAAQNVIADLVPPTSDGDGQPFAGVVMNGVAYFEARDAFGRELWRCDGTAAGTWRVKDVNPGSTGSDIRDLTVVGNQLFFTAISSNYGRELWVSDGTAPGTRLVDDLLEAFNFSSSPSDLVAFQGRLWFAATVNGNRFLYSSDGTAAGTAPHNAWTGVSQLTLAGGWLYYVATGGVGNGTLCRTDGTLAGTQAIGGAGIGILDLIGVGNRVFFTASYASPSTGRELFVSDGTLTGTQLVLDINPGATGSSPSEIVALDANTIVFRASDGTHGVEPWRSDGTATGTFLLADVAAGSATSSPTELTTANGIAVWNGTANGDTELWVTDGTVAGTQMFDLLATGSSIPQRMTPALGGIVFRAGTATGGTEFWFTDGTFAGTYAIDVLPGIAPSAPADFTAFGSRVLFSASTTGFGGAERELHVSDGTVGGTALLTDLYPIALAGSDPRLLRALDGRMFFEADQQGQQSRPWITDGTVGGTVALSTSIAVDVEAVRWRNRIWFGGIVSATGHELFVSDGTPAGTTLAVDINPGSAHSNPAVLTPTANRLFCRATTAAGNELVTTDGTPASTTVLDLNPTASSNPELLTAVGNKVFGRANDGTHGLELFVSDGTAAGTTVLDVVAGSGSSSPRELTAFGARLFFVATTPTTGFELFVSDGTPAGTGLFINSSGTAANSNPSHLTVAGGRLFFELPNLAGGQLWSTDGTVAGTAFVKDLNPTGSATVHEAVGAGCKLFFFANDTFSLTGNELYVSDGTTAGTDRVLDLLPGSGSGVVLGTLTAIPGSARVVFVGTDGSDGLQLFVSDGTAAGTRQLGSINPAGGGAGAATIGGLTVVGDDLLFWCDDGTTGDEPWIVSLTAGNPQPFALTASYGEGCAGTAGLTPRISACTEPVLGNLSFTVDLDRARANTIAQALVEFAPAYLPVGGGCAFLVPQPAFPLLLVFTDAGGRASSPLPIPSSASFLGLGMFAQYGVYDPNGAFLGTGAGSNGLAIRLGL
ncbi:MAG: hypothetical protein KDE27_30610 [Planctomycetes bacterium]|nr:hypothetical protein [Planctomycetota bacterium]